MTPKQIESFFRILARELDRPATVILTGAAAGALMGSIRPSLDVDFAIRPARRSPSSWAEVDAAVQKAVRASGVPANYAEDIERWGMVSLLDYRKHATPYKRLGKLDLRLMHPAYWSIGKMTRYLDSDVSDLVAVFKRQKAPAEKLVDLWAKALKASPASTGLFLFRKQVEHFLTEHGPAVWGRSFDAAVAVARFRKRASPTPR